MRFEELQVVWNKQQSEPLFAINRDALHACVLRKATKIERCTEWFEWTMVGVPLLMAVILVIDAWQDVGGWDQYVVSGVCLVVGLLTAKGRMRRQVTPVDFDQSMRGIIENCIRRIDDHVRAVRLAFWGFHLPVAVSAAIGLTFYSSVRTPLFGGGVLVITSISYWSTMRECRGKVHEKTDLEQLLTKLSEADR